MHAVAQRHQYTLPCVGLSISTDINKQKTSCKEMIPCFILSLSKQNNNCNVASCRTVEMFTTYKFKVLWTGNSRVLWSCSAVSEEAFTVSLLPLHSPPFNYSSLWPQICSKKAPTSPQLWGEFVKINSYHDIGYLCLLQARAPIMLLLAHDGDGMRWKCSSPSKRRALSELA